MSTPHIAAEKGQIAERILLPGDPLRAKYIAENFLNGAKEYTHVRNILGYTGTYKGVPVSVQGTGMGIPSISIYVHELIHEYGCKKLFRVGTCGGMHPDVENYKEALNHVTELGLKGIKIHPAYQGADFDDIRYLRIIDKASELGLIVLTHAGWDIGIPGHNYCDTGHVQHVMQEVGPDRLVLAHMGGWQDWKAVGEELAGLPLYFDASFSTGDIVPAPGTTRTPEESHNMSREQFIHLVRKLGTDRILFATDCPWSDQAESLRFVRSCGFSQQELADLLGNNAQKLLDI